MIHSQLVSSKQLSKAKMLVEAIEILSAQKDRFSNKLRTLKSKEPVRVQTKKRGNFGRTCSVCW